MRLSLLSPVSLHPSSSLSPPDLVIRSHEVKQDGYEVAHGGKCVTVFSAPNYWWVWLTELLVYFVCFHSDQMGNKGAYVTLTRDLRPQFTTYEAVVSYTLHHHYIILIHPLPPPPASPQV